MEKLTIQIFTDPPAEIRDAFEFNAAKDVRDFIQPLINEGMLAIREVRRGWFIESRQG